MKKILLSVLILALGVSLLAGCSEEGESSDLNIYSEASYDNESKFVPDEESKGNESSDEEAFTGEFVVKDKKYTFEGNDLVLVSVENKTNKNYSVTITGTYLDKDGKAIKTETQTYDQYSAGFSNYFLFMPEMQFESFTYEFKTQEAEGPFYAKDLTIKYNGLDHTRVGIWEEELKENFTRYPSVSTSLSYQYLCKIQATFLIRVLLVTEEGEVLFLYDRLKNFHSAQEFNDGVEQMPIWQSRDENREYPAEFNNLKIIPIIVKSCTDPSAVYPVRRINTIIE